MKTTTQRRGLSIEERTERFLTSRFGTSPWSAKSLAQYKALLNFTAMYATHPEMRAAAASALGEEPLRSV